MSETKTAISWSSPGESTRTPFMGVVEEISLTDDIQLGEDEEEP